ncbi:MAG: hypothetical protein SCI25_15665 [Desulfuromonadales bacterium]|nr:hypothetical protein [Desulfuromonadales bacterium]
MKIIEQKNMFITGALFLLFGFLYYLVIRSADNLYITNNTNYLNIFTIFNNKLNYTDSIPSFIHVVSFSLITISLVELNRKSIILACTSWVVINVVFEYLQGFNASLKTFSGQNIFYAFLQNGTFDSNDVGFSILGGFFAAFIAIIFLYKRRKF